MGKFGKYCLVKGLLIVATLAASSCIGSPGTNENLSEAEKTLEAYYLNATLQSMSTQVADEATFGTRVNRNEETTIGDINNDQAMLLIPPGAFDDRTEVALETLTDIPTVNLKGVAPLDNAISISLLSAHQRSSKPVLVSLKFDNLGIQEPGEILVGAYHNNDGWELFEPDQIDLEQGLLTFTTYHFSVFSPMRVDESVRMQRAITQQAKRDFVDQLAFEQGCQEVNLMVEALMQEGLDIQDDQMIETMVSEVMAQIPTSAISTALTELDQFALTDAVIQTTAEALVKKLTDKSIPINSISAGYNSDKAIKEAYRIAARSKRDTAQRILTNHLSDTLQATGSFHEHARRALVLGEFTKQLWSNREVENAYTVYAQGAESGCYGYSAEKGNFDQIMSNNRGSLESILNAFVTAYCRIKCLDESRLEKAALDSVRAEGLVELKNQFDLYLARSTDLDKQAEDMLSLMELYASKGLLERSLGKNPMIEGNDDVDLEALMEQLTITQKMITSQLGRQEIVDAALWQSSDASERLTMIPRETVAELVYQWFKQDLDLKPLAFVEISQALQIRLENNSGVGTEDVSVLVNEILNEFDQ